MANQILSTNALSFKKILNLNNRSYEFTLDLDHQDSVLTFKVIDQTDPQNPQQFSNCFSLIQDNNSYN